jgi:hypothetical protein
MSAATASLATASFAAALLFAPSPATAAPEPEAAADDVGFVVLRENGSGSAAQAEPFVAEMLGAMYRLTGWGEPRFQFFTARKKAKAYIDETKPHFGILTFGAYLGMHSKYKYTTIGEADAAGSGGGQYYLISRTESDLAGCKGKTLASNHFDDETFVDRVISGGAFTLSEFEVIKTKRPVQTIKKVTRDEATCALIDHAQFEALQKLDGSESVRTVWFSKGFASYVVVAFPEASKAQVKSLRDNLEKVCTGSGKETCERAGVTKLDEVAADAFAAEIAAYNG